MDTSGLFPPLDRGAGFPSTNTHQSLVHDALQALETGDSVASVFRDPRWHQARSSATQWSWRAFLSQRQCPESSAFSSLQLPPPDPDTRQDPLREPISLGTSHDQDSDSSRSFFRSLIQWLAPYISSIPDRAVPSHTGPLTGGTPHLSPGAVTFQAEDHTAGTQTLDDFTLTTAHGIVHITRGSTFIGSLSQARWRLLTQDGSTDVDPTGGSCGKEHRHPLASVLAWAPESTKSSLRLGLQRTRRTFVISNSVSQLDYSGRMGLGITTSRHLAPSGNHPEPPQRGRI